MLPERMIQVKCPRCGWVHRPVPDDEGAGATHCVNCHGATGAEFERARPKDAPFGARILPIRIPEAHLRELGIDIAETLAAADHVP